MLTAERPVAVLPFVEGAIPAEVTPDLAEQCGELLARMHVLTADWNDERIPVIDREGLIRQALEARPSLEGVPEWHAELRAFEAAESGRLSQLAGLPSGDLPYAVFALSGLVNRRRVALASREGVAASEGEPRIAGGTASTDGKGTGT
jgi:hypothetical protein